MQVSLRAKVDLPPDDVYEILIAPDNSAVFKGIKVSHMIRQPKDEQLCPPFWKGRVDALAGFMLQDSI